MALNWKGDQLLRKLKRVQEKSINDTLSATVSRARSGHGGGARGRRRFQSRSGRLVRSIKVLRKASKVRAGIRGAAGSRGVRYAMPVEARFPYLRPAARKENERLSKRVRKGVR